METALQVFQFDGATRIRTFLHATKGPVFILADLCIPLGIQNTSRVITRLENDDLISMKVADRRGQVQLMHAVTEAGVYDLVLGSRKLIAQKFKHWLTHEVLPSLRQTGTYTMPGHQEIAQKQLYAPPTPEKIVLPGVRRTMPQRAIARRVEVSTYMAQAWHVLRTVDAWISNAELAQRAGIGERSARSYTYYFFSIGILACQEMFPCHLYRLKRDAAQQFPDIIKHLDTCYEILMERAKF